MDDYKNNYLLTIDLEMMVSKSTPSNDKFEIINDSLGINLASIAHSVYIFKYKHISLF